MMKVKINLNDLAKQPELAGKPKRVKDARKKAGRPYPAGPACLRALLDAVKTARFGAILAVFLHDMFWTIPNCGWVLG